MVVVGLYKSTIKEASRVQVKGGQFLNNRAAYFGVAPFSIRGGVFKYDLSLIGCPSYGMLPCPSLRSVGICRICK